MCKSPEPKEFGRFKRLNEEPCATTTRSKRRFGESVTEGIGRGQITWSPAGYIKNLGLYHKLKRKPFKSFSDGSDIKLYFEKMISVIL